MREIKVKAWDGKIMSEPFTLDQASYEGFPRPVVDDNGECRTNIKITWILSTGLLDKNSKEIYEGDILECGIWEDNSVVGVVEYNEKLGRYEVNDKNHHDLIGRVICRREIIGNIYENPELLKK
jgi:hypothetical protein